MAKEQKDLPGMEDRALADLEEKAREYVKLRDKRMALGAKEVLLKGEILALMKKHKKPTYTHGDIEIEVVVEKEKIRVKILNEPEGAEESAE